MEWRLFPAGTVPRVSTAAFHADRARAPHLEQPEHRGRLLAAAEYVWHAAGLLAGTPGRADPVVGVSDLGCGDGGLLSLLACGPRTAVLLRAWGYDLCPANASGWAERGVDGRLLDVFGDDWESVRLGDVAVVTEVLEHLADPHAALRWLGGRCPYLVASSPRTETGESHDPCHAWAWDGDGYRALIESGGYAVLARREVGPFQVVLGGPR